MPSRSIEQLNATDNEIRSYFSENYSACVPQNLNYLFEIALNNKNLFPNMNLPDGATHRDYIDRWVRSYLEAENNPARNRTASPKGSCNDPAVKAIVQMVTQVSDDIASIQESHHNLFMSAENIQGALLEEYIDSVISGYGWIWCKGNTLRSVDFCTPDGNHLLQIKNKSNSENSSSSNIRSGTNIEKWYRLGTRTIAGKKIPDYKWAILNEIIQNTSGKPCNLSEGDYIRYIENVATNNPSLITDQ
jgi:hypothetical protein